MGRVSLVTQMGPMESQRKTHDNGSRGHREIRRCYAAGLEVGGGRPEPRHAALDREEAWKWFFPTSPKVPAFQPLETDFRLPTSRTIRERRCGMLVF